MGRKPVNKERIDKPEVRLKWITELMPLYFKGALRDFTMDEIAAELKISKATLYKHYSSRLEILEDVVELKIKQIFRFAVVLDDRVMPFEKRYDEAVKVASIELAGISNGFLYSLKTMHPDLWQKIMDFLDLATERIRLFYQEGIELGILKNYDPKLLALTDKIIITAFSDPQILIDNDLSLQTAIEGYFSIKNTGIFLKDKH